VTFILSKGIEKSEYNKVNEEFAKTFNKNHLEEFFTPSKLAGDYFLRTAFGNPTTSFEHIDRLWAKMQSTAEI
jgi:hypothetical protein